MCFPPCRGPLLNIWAIEKLTPKGEGMRMGADGNYALMETPRKWKQFPRVNSGPLLVMPSSIWVPSYRWFVTVVAAGYWSKTWKQWTQLPSLDKASCVLNKVFLNFCLAAVAESGSSLCGWLRPGPWLTSEFLGAAMHYLYIYNLIYYILYHIIYYMELLADPMIDRKSWLLNLLKGKRFCFYYFQCRLVIAPACQIKPDESQRESWRMNHMQSEGITAGQLHLVIS